MTKHASHAHLTTLLLGTTQAPTHTPPPPFAASLVACHVGDLAQAYSSLTCWICFQVALHRVVPGRAVT